MHAAVDSLAETPVSTLRGVGPKMAERLARLSIHSVQDVLFHLPLRYQDRTRIVPVGSLRPGDQAVIEVDIDHAEVRLGRRRSLLVRVSDGTGALILRFFHFSGAQKEALSAGTRLRCYGEVRNGPTLYELVHPEYQPVTDSAPPLEQALTPIYPTTEGLHQLSWRDFTDQALALLERGGGLQELLPPALLQQLQLPALGEALRLLHRPPVQASTQLLSEGGHPAQQRLAFEELLAHQLSLRLLRAQHRSQRAPAIRSSSDAQSLAAQLLAALPFALTAAQQRVLDEVVADLQQPYPMMRLLQGDVGCGKTVVAALAALHMVEAGYQVVLMAPTELLAEQHRNNFQQWLEPLGVEIAWLSGRHKGKQRAALLDQLVTGQVRVLVGTHALFQDDVQYQRLGLVMVDEQHRFGVHQRLALRQKGGELIPHQLIMTATPIPRTLAMTAYADLDLSVIDQLPPGRTPVQTVVLSDQRRAEIIARVAENCSKGRQAYWVCTLIEESEALQAQAAEDTAQQLTEALRPLRVGLVHGRLKAAEKAQVMAAFRNAELDLLVATTVIEVGVDVPNASLMVIENAERLGLAQLHQLRGRVGRGAQASHCVLIYQAPLGQVARQRLAVMRETNDGFVVAQEDLAIRGPGEVLGTRQTGEVQFRIADLLRDNDLLPQVREAAELLSDQPKRVQALIHRWLGERLNYSVV